MSEAGTERLNEEGNMPKVPLTSGPSTQRAGAPPHRSVISLPAGTAGSLTAGTAGMEAIRRKKVALRLEDRHSGAWVGRSRR